MIVDSDFNKEVWGDGESTFIAPCKCSYCDKEFDFEKCPFKKWAYVKDLLKL